MAIAITDKQRAVFAYLKANILAGSPPSLMEICANFGWTSHTAARAHVSALERRGLILKSKGNHRGINLTEAGRKQPTDSQPEPIAEAQ